MTKGPIVIIEDDQDDQDIYTECFRSLAIPNEILFFDNGKDALDYLLTTNHQPFAILSDINLPAMNGLDLRKYIQDDPYLTVKGIPFVFISTNANKASVRRAYALSVQGYFEKPSNMTAMQAMLKTLLDYWTLCKHINNT